MVAFIVGNSHPDQPVEPIPSSVSIKTRGETDAGFSCEASSIGDCTAPKCQESSHFVWAEVSDTSLVVGSTEVRDVSINLRSVVGLSRCGATDLLPGLPHDIAVSCIARVPLAYHHMLAIGNGSFTTITSSCLVSWQDFVLYLFHFPHAVLVAFFAYALYAAVFAA